MLIYIKISNKKKFLRTDRRTTQNYSSEPHKKSLYKNLKVLVEGGQFSYFKISKGVGITFLSLFC
jgi:hypothetical protein